MQYLVSFYRLEFETTQRRRRDHMLRKQMSFNDDSVWIGFERRDFTKYDNLIIVKTLL